MDSGPLGWPGRYHSRKTLHIEIAPWLPKSRRTTKVRPLADNKSTVRQPEAPDKQAAATEEEDFTPTIVGDQPAEQDAKLARTNEERSDPTPATAPLNVKELGLTAHPVDGEGNCLYHFGTDPKGKFPKDHRTIRALTVQKLTTQGALFHDIWDHLDDQGKPCNNWLTYTTRQAKEGAWGGELEILALASHFGLCRGAAAGQRERPVWNGEAHDLAAIREEADTPSLPSVDSTKLSAARQEHIKCISQYNKLSIQKWAEAREVTKSVGLRGGASSTASSRRTLAQALPSTPLQR